MPWGIIAVPVIICFIIGLRSGFKRTADDASEETNLD